jgi:hypothetical protein
VNGVPAVTGVLIFMPIVDTGPTTAKLPLWPTCPPLTTLIRSLCSGIGILADVVLTPLTKLEGPAGESWAESSDHVAEPF